MQGFAINEKRLEQKQQEVEYLKTGIRILNRAIEEQTGNTDSETMQRPMIDRQNRSLATLLYFDPKVNLNPICP
ncbi:MAG: hypothetical protein MZV64_20820 [Ignavibacteriales bacterium]|nr:hypothetical protein [Ignavibacteriales bacterium]